MVMIIANDDLVITLDYMTSSADAADWKLRLYQNNWTPSHADVLSDYMEATFSGYAEAFPAFGGATLVGDQAVADDSAPRVFTHNGGGTQNDVYGYYIVNSVSGKLVSAERFALPFHFEFNGDTLSVTAQLTLESLN